MVNNHFTDNSLLSVSVEQRSVNGALPCLDTLCVTSGFVVSNHKIEFWLVGLDSPPDWIPAMSTYIQPGVIVKYLGIPFGVGLSPVSMWEWYLQKL